MEERKEPWTPGPWEPGSDFPHYVVAGDFAVCDVSNPAFPRSEESANARLIAAAPDMAAELEACADVLADFLNYAEAMRAFGRGYATTDRHGRDAGSVYDAARALLARIRGAA